MLSPLEQERAARYRFEEDRRRFIAGRASLRRILGERTGTRAGDLVFEESDNQKPRLKLHSQRPVFFNVSHSGNYVIIAVSDNSEVGVDIEQVRKDCPIDDLARRYYDAREHERLRKSPPSLRLLHFYRLWTIKEAVLKCAGLGLSVPPAAVRVQLTANRKPIITCLDERHRSLERFSAQELALADGYAAAVAVDAELANIEIIDAQ